jgi:hypothetical protein
VSLEILPSAIQKPGERNTKIKDTTFFFSQTSEKEY